MTTIHATGHEPATAASLTVSGGKGNTERPEIHFIVNHDTEDGRQTFAGWFDRDALLDAITDADSAGRNAPRTRLTEPAAAL